MKSLILLKLLAFHVIQGNGTNAMMLSLVFLLIGSLAAFPDEDYRSNLEFLGYNSNIADVGYRLDESVYPHTMDLDLDVYLNDNYLNGELTMGIEVRQENLTQIVFHQKVTMITAVDIVDSNNRVINLKFPDPFTTDDYYELIKLNLAGPIDLGNYTIRMSYRAAINENPVDRGFYKGYYFQNNQEVAYATTQFQPGNARKAFPCFDEPTFKSRYRLSITRDASLSPSYSNMAIAYNETVGTNRIREVFYPTPIISAYLVAFHVSDFIESEVTSTPNRPFKIISRPGVLNQHAFAGEIGVKVTNALDDYFGILYHEMGQGVLMKNDHIALPDFPSGAMENWGMVNYREAYLLYDPQNMNLPNKITIATIMAHELAHKWFGNLVTTFWWGNLWLNESFASFFEYFAAHWAHPAFELDDQFIVDYVHSALSADSSAGVAPMNWTGVASLPSISAHFSTSSYAKGASVLRMMENFVGPRNFKLALQYYLRNNAYGVGRNDDMYNAFRQAISEDYEFLRDYDVDVGDVFESWVQNPGAPVVMVNVNTATGEIQVTQQRYTLSGNRPNTIWHIPLTWTTENELNFQDIKPKLVLFTESTTITNPPGNSWVIFNVGQSGYYRVNYDDENWVRIGNYLKSSSRQNIHKMNRAQIVNDLLFFVRSGDVNQTLAFSVLEFLKNETDYYVWNGAISQLEFIRRRFEHLPEAHEAFTDFLLELLENVIETLGYEEAANEPTSITLNRMQIMNLACNLGHTGCVTDALNKWTAFRNNDNQSVPVNSRRYVYCVGLREGDASDYNFLFQKYESSESTADMVVMLRALGCTRHEASFNNYLQQSLVNRRIRVHDRTNVMSFAVQGNKENLPLVLNFLYQNYNQIRTAYGGPDRLSTAMNAIPGYLTDFNLIQQYQNWVYENQVGLANSFSTGASGVNSALNNLNWGNANAPEIYSFLLGRSSSTNIVASAFLILSVLFIQLFR